MKRARAQAVLSLTILVACCAWTFALDPSLDISQYAHSSWKVRDGFTKGAIFSIAQTPDGYLWLGTEFGLYRFDGVRAVPWQPRNGQRLPAGRVRSLLAARDGTLWIGMDDGLASWRDGALVQYPGVRQGAFALFEDREGTIWVGGQTLDDRAGQLCSIRGRDTQCYRGDFGPTVSAAYEDREGNLWVGTAKGLWHWKPGPPEFYPMQSPAWFVVQDETGDLLIGTRNGITHFAAGRFEAYSLPVIAKLQVKYGTAIRDSDGGLWIGTYDHGLVHVGQASTETYPSSDGLSGDFVYAVLEDREGSIWVATGSGLDRFRHPAVPGISVKQGLSNSTANSVLAAKDGSVWIGTVDGLNRWTHGQISVYRRSRTLAPRTFLKSVHEVVNNGLPSDDIGSLLQDRDGRVWISTMSGAAYLEGDRFLAPDLGPNRILNFSEDGSGHVWILDIAKGLVDVAGRRVAGRYPWAELGHKDYADTLLADHTQSGVWLGFKGGGAVYFRDGRVQASYPASDGLGSGQVSHLRFGSRGSVWVATRGGLSRIRDNRVTTLTSKNGLPCDTVHWSMEDDEHAIWLYMSCGLVRVERGELDTWAADAKHMVKTAVFDSFDGVWAHMMPPTGYAPAVSKTPDGKIWFVTGDGVSVIDPHHLHENKLPPPVHIENITADDKTVDISNGMHLPAGVRHLDIDYTALSLVVPEKVRFRVKLEGEDKDWRELVNVRHVEYTNLPPKHYKFRVLACNNSGVWNEEGAALDFVIPPAWYQTNWFRAACILAFLGMIWGIHELRVRQLAHQFNMRLEERVSERTRIARDLHDTLLQSFQGLLLQFQAISYRLQPGEIKNALEAVTAEASQAVTEGRDSIQGLRASIVEKDNLAEAIRAIGEELASTAINQPSPAFEVMVEGRRKRKHPIVRDEVYRIAVEALRNAFHHSQATKIEVELLYEDKDFKIRVRDNGKGINRDVLGGDGRAGHFGLHGMRERAKLIGGELTIWSEADSGTEIELSIPASRAYTRSARSSWFFRRFSQKDTDAKEKVES